MESTFTVPSINAKIICDTNGTADEKTVYVKVNCEMSIFEAEVLAQAILRAKEWLEQQKKDLSE